jgi:hypothetical protein
MDMADLGNMPDIDYNRLVSDARIERNEHARTCVHCTGERCNGWDKLQAVVVAAIRARDHARNIARRNLDK